jgi:hypothetical protein
VSDGSSNPALRKNREGQGTRLSRVGREGQGSRPRPLNEEGLLTVLSPCRKVSCGTTLALSLTGGGGWTEELELRH